MGLGTNRDYKTADRRARTALTEHTRRIQHLVEDCGLERLEASRLALLQMQNKVCSDCGADFGKRHHPSCSRPVAQYDTPMVSADTKMNIQRVNQSTVKAFWISALYNRTVVDELMIDRAMNRHSMHLLCDRLAVRVGYQPGRLATSFMPVYNPTDVSPWPELLGWLITVGEVETVTIEHTNDAHLKGELR